MMGETNMKKFSVEKTLLKAKSLGKKGEIETAQKLYQIVLQAFPNNKRAQEGLAALNKPEQFTTTQGLPQDTINKLINHYNQGQLVVVVEQAQALTEQYPEAFIVWNILGAAYKGLGKTYEASKAFKKVTELNPTYADGFSNLGATLQDQGKLNEAIEACNKALALKPDYAEAYYNMSITLQDQGKLNKAIEACNKALALEPDYAEVYHNMGIALQNQGKLEEAIEACNKALALKPDYSEVYYNMGIAFQNQGKLEEAIASYSKALTIKPNYAKAARNLVKLPIGSIDEKTISELNKKLSLISANIDDQSQKLFFKANLFSHKGKYDEAFKIFVDANYIQSEKNILSMKSAQNQYDAAFKRISRWSVNLQSEEKDLVKKIFILGPSRSGKSTLENLLIGSPNVCPMFENINLNVIPEIKLSKEKPKKISMIDLFHHDENSLFKLGYNALTSTKPTSMFHIDYLIDNFSSAFCIFVERNRVDIASEIFTKEYRKGNLYAYNHSNISKYLDSYEAIWEILKQKVPQLTLEISFEDILFKPQEVVEKISGLTNISFQIDNTQNHSITNLANPFREHYRSHFMTS